jgi:hypothetical protein
VSRVELIVCERTSRWTSALRMALAGAAEPCRLRETRRLTEIETELAERPACIAAIEVHLDNLANVLDWIPKARQHFARTQFVALADQSLAADWDAVADILTEAGINALAASPRRLDAVLSLARLQAKLPVIVDESEPLTARVWASLPWQRR